MNLSFVLCELTHMLTYQSEFTIVMKITVTKVYKLIMIQSQLNSVNNFHLFVYLLCISFLFFSII